MQECLSALPELHGAVTVRKTGRIVYNEIC